MCRIPPYAKFGRVVIVYLCLVSGFSFASSQRTPQEEGKLLYCFYLLFSLLKSSMCDGFGDLRPVYCRRSLPRVQMDF